MAGRPKQRIKALTTALRANGIDPEQLLTAAPGATGDATHTAGMEDLDPKAPHARTREGRPAVNARVQIGPATRSEADRLTASDLERLAGLLSPGLTVRIERTRPTWAAGWVEDLMIDDHDLGAVLDYLSQEHGGQMYRASVIAVDGAQLYTARIPIAGPPRQRGRLRTRAQWDGTDEPTTTQAPQFQQTAQPIQQFGIPEITQLLELLQRGQHDRQDTLVQSVREMNAANQTTTNAMLKALMSQREEQTKGGSLREQLRELVSATHAIEEVREVLGVKPEAPQRDDGADESGMNKVFEQVAAGILQQGLQNDAARTRPTTGPAAPPPGFRRPPPPRRQPAPTNGQPRQAPRPAPTTEPKT